MGWVLGRVVGGCIIMFPGESLSPINCLSVLLIL